MIKRLTYFISLLMLPSITLAQFQTKAELQAAVNLWVSNNATALSTYGEINTWNVSQITDMSELFRDKTTFNDDISNWNVSSVTDMEYMFFNAEAFNQPLNDWVVSSVTNMERMFESADIFNQDISNWNVSNVTTMRKMFQSATSFNQAVNDWDVSSVTNMVYMFMFAGAFNQDLNDWNVSSVTNMVYMFMLSAFNQDLNDWNVSSVTNMSNMFRDANSFNQDISNWDVSSVTNMTDMFVGTDDLSDENKCAIHGSFRSNSAWPYDWLGDCSDYKWFSSDSSGGPIYSWHDITSTGQISMFGDDINTGPHQIGFSFPFYGIDYTTFRISTNGWISFTSTSSQYSNFQLPGTNSPEAMLAPFWDDLNFQSNKAYYYSDGSQLVITFNDVPRLGQESTSSYTFQVILSATGEIVYQYNTMTGPLNGATIGWQDDTRTQGTSIVYNYTNYALIHNSWALSLIHI